jgi:Ala-tRNA(Pro) deacylase
MTAEVLPRLRALLDGAGVAYRYVEHAPTRTSEESAAARGEPLAVGGKALLLKSGDVFGLFVLSAARSLDSDAVRRRSGVKRMRFATADELRDMTGLVPGSVPPFGEPVLPFPLHVDPSVLANDRIAFNAGSLTASMVVPIADYRRVAQPFEVFDFSRPA